ncbi:MAG: hypothetical protein AAGI52_08205 [Bacteroidota bacterium]
MRVVLLLVGCLVPVFATAQTPPCSVEDDITCAGKALHPYHVIWVGGYLRGLHTAEALDLERLVQAPISLIDEMSPSLILAGVLPAMRDAAPDVVASFVEARSFPEDPEEQARYVRGLIDAFVHAGIELSDLPLPEEQVETIEVYTIGGSN